MNLKPPLWGLAALALAGRLWLAWCFEGTSDIGRWRTFTQLVEAGRFDTLYRQHYPLWNHPAPVVLLLKLVAWTERGLGLPFHFAFKLWPALADTATALLVFLLGRARFGERRAFGVAVCYLLSPLSALISGYHGNTDAIMVFWLCAALALWRRPELSALAFAGALCTKYTAALLLPLALSALPDWRLRLRYLGLCLAPIAVISLPFAWSYPYAFRRNILGYGSLQNTWGLGHVNLLLRRGELGRFGRELLPAVRFLIDNGKLLILAPVIGLALLNLRRRRLDAVEALALGFAWFLSVTPGFGVQYAIWPLPFFLLAQRPLGHAYHLAAIMFALAAYDAGQYTRTGLNDPLLRPKPAALLAWMCVLLLAARLGWLLLRPLRQSPASSASTRTNAL